MKTHPYSGYFMMVILFLVMTTNSFGEAQPQPWRYKVEIFGGAGWGNFHHGDTGYGGGLNWSGGIGVRPFSGILHGLGFEGEISGLHFTDRSGTKYESKGDRTVVSGNALYHFGRHNTQFFLLGGFGSFHANYYYQIPDSQYQVEGNKMSLNLGLGVKAKIASHLSIRPEVRIFDTTIGSGYNWSSLQLSCGVSYHW
jgi:hypothetical protein